MSYKISFLNGSNPVKRSDEMAEAISIEMGAPIDWATEQQSSTGAGHIKTFIQTLKNFEFEKSFDQNDSTGAPLGLVMLCEFSPRSFCGEK